MCVAVEEVEEDLDLGQTTKAAKLEEVEDDMDVDSFLEKGFFEAMEASGDGDDEEASEDGQDSVGVQKKAKKSEMDETDLADEMAQHKRDLDELKKDSKQAAFLEYLQKESPGLLEGLDDMDEDEEGGDAAGLDAQHPVLTMAILEMWKTSLLKDKSLPALKRLVQAFRVASHMNQNAEETGNPEESKSDTRFSYRIADPVVFNEVILFTVSNFGKALQAILGKSKEVVESDSGQKSHRAGFNAARFPKWSKVKDVTRSFFVNLYSFLIQLSDPKMINFVLQHLEHLVKYLSPYASIQKQFLKVHLTLWSSSTESVRIFAFFNIRKMALELPYPFIDHVLKGIYLTYVRNCKFVNRTTIPLVNFLCNCVVELYGLDFVSSYQHAFVYIRELASHLRNSFTSKKKEIRKNVYNFQYINSINAWVRILAAYPTEETLSLLYYPLVQLIQGTIAYQPTNRYFPLRLRCVQMLNDLAVASRSYINSASYLLEILASSDMYKRPRASMEKTLDIRSNLKVSKILIGTKVYQDVIFDEAFDRLVEYLATYSRSIAFPELVFPILNALSKFKQSTHNVSHSKRIKQLQDKIQTTVKLIQAKRNQVSFSPKEIASVSKFLGDEATPLTKMWEEIAAIALAQQQQAAKEAAAAAKKSKNGKVDEVEEDDDDDDIDDDESSDGEQHSDVDSEASDLEVLNSDDDLVQEIDEDMLVDEEEEDE